MGQAVVHGEVVSLAISGPTCLPGLLLFLQLGGPSSLALELPLALA